MKIHSLVKWSTAVFVCLLLIFIAGCGNSATSGDTLPEESSSQEITSIPIQSIEPTQKPVYDFSDVELPPGFLNANEFENSRGGDSIETVLKQEQNQEDQMIILVKPSVEILGLPFRAEFVFLTGTDGSLTLQDGSYYRDLNLDFLEPMPTLIQMTQDFDLLYTYFTQLWGEPERKQFYYVESNSDGTKQINAEEVESFDAFLDSTSVDACATWRLSTDNGSSWFYRLEMATNGIISVSKTSIAMAPQT